MSKFYLLPLLFLVALGLTAQPVSQQPATDTSLLEERLMPPPVLLGKITDATNININLFPVLKGEVVTVSGTETYSNKHPLLPTLLKGVAMTGLSYQAIKTANIVYGKKASKGTALKNALPAIALGAVLPLKSLFGMGKARAGLNYYLYDKDTLLVGSGSYRIPKNARNKPVPFRHLTAIPQDGFIRFDYANKSKAAILLTDVEVTTTARQNITYEGGIAETTNTQSYGECLPEVTVYPPCDPRNPNYSPTYCLPDGSGGQSPACNQYPSFCGCPYAPSNACDSYGYNPNPNPGGGGGGGGWFPSPSVTPDGQEYPCTTLDQTSEHLGNSYYNADVASTVANFTPLSTTDPTQPEQSFTVNNGVVTPIQTLGQNGGVPPNVDATTQIIVHTHPYGGVNGGLPSPTLQDLFQLYDAPSAQASYVVAYDGTKYAMVVTDMSRLRLFIQSNPDFFNSDGSTNINNPWGNAYAQAVLQFNEIDGLSLAESTERARAFIMSIAGVTLTKQSPGSNQFKKIGANMKLDIYGRPKKDSNGFYVFYKADCP